MMKKQQHPLVPDFLKSKIVAILRGLTPEKAVKSGEILFENGVTLMEIPLNTPNALLGIELLAKHFKGTRVHIGAGTVLTPEAVDAAADAGCEYIISPNTDTAVIRRTIEKGLLSMPGFATPSEAFSAIAAGADILKQFPCETPQRISVLKSVITLPVFAVGGIDSSNAKAYLKTADGVGVGIGIFKPSMNEEELAVSAKRFMESLK